MDKTSRLGLPIFSKIDPEQIEPALDAILTSNRAQLKQLLQQERYTWDNLMQPLEDMHDHLDGEWSIINHLHSVMDSEKLREAYNTCLPKLTDYGTEVSQNVDLYNAMNAIVQSKDYDSLNAAQKKTIEYQLRDFRLAGVHLQKEQKDCFAQLNKELSRLTTLFEENVLDATQSWSRLVTDAAELAGIPDHAISAAKKTAVSKNLEGWLFTLGMPSYHAVMTYADSSTLREEMYYAYTTRASDQGPNAGHNDNTEVIGQILAVRLEMAKILGFKNYAEYSLATKMVKKPDEVLEFLNKLAKASLGKAKKEFAELSEFAKEQYGISPLQVWDINYISEKLCQHCYAISQEDLRPYFPEDQVILGMFDVVNRLYGMNIVEVKSVDVWHQDVRFFEIYDENNELRGQFYLDLYARLNKRSGAWMDDCRARRKLKNGEIQTPIAFLTCNFNAPTNHEPALFTHDEVITLFHEFGHGLQHMLTKIDYAEVSGINGIPWDAVEIASQFMENWCWQKESLQLIAKHYQTKSALPRELFEKMIRSKNFQSAMQVVRQLEFALFDFRLHLEYDPAQSNQTQNILDEVRSEVAVIKATSFNRFQNGFTHVFSGGYAAGYYSYKWAELFACDAFSKFEENGIFDAKSGKEFLHTFLESGGVIDPAILFIQFRGRPPKIDALLRLNGISN